MASQPSEMRCREMVDLLADYLEGNLPADNARSLEAHLEGCPPCIAFVNTYKGTVQAVRKLRESEIPKELRERLTAFLRQRSG